MTCQLLAQGRCGETQDAGGTAGHRRVMPGCGGLVSGVAAAAGEPRVWPSLRHGWPTEAAETWVGRAHIAARSRKARHGGAERAKKGGKS